MRLERVVPALVLAGLALSPSEAPGQAGLLAFEVRRSVAAGLPAGATHHNGIDGIVSGVTGVLAPEHDGFDLFAATFPAGTVTGAPKLRAMQRIDEIEPVRRGFYAGSVGYFGYGGSLDQALAIRTLVFDDGRYAYQAGAGIVSDSDPGREHAEVLAKSAALSGALALAEEIA